MQAVNARNANSESPLHVAVGFLDANAVRGLIDAGAKIDAVDRWRRTPLFRLVNMRIASYARLDEMKDNRLRIVDAFLKADPKPNAVLSVGKTLLQHAAQWSHSELVQLLLDSGADPNRSGHSPSDALRLAIRNGDPASVDVLLKAGAETGYKIRGWTPLDLARELERRSEARNKKARDVTDAALAKTRAFGECATLLENPPLIVRAKPDQLQRQRQLRHKRYREEGGSKRR